MTPIPYVEHRTIHHASPNVHVHDVYDAPYYGGYGPIQYAGPVVSHHVHHGHHVAHT